MALGDDLGQRRLRRQRVAGKRHVEAARHRAFGDAGEHLLGIAQPVAAVEEHQQRRLRLAATEQIDAIARARPVGEVERVLMLRAQVRAALRPFFHLGRAGLDRGGVVVGDVELGAGHAAPDDGC